MSALERYKISLEVNEKNLAKLQATSEPSDPVIIMMRNNQAWLLTKLGRYKEALNIYEDILQLQREKDGEDPDTLIAKNNLACALSNMGRYEDALKILREVYDKRNSKYNELLNTKRTKSKCDNESKNELGRAKNELNRAEYNLACLLFNMQEDHWEKSLDLIKRILEEREKLLGEDHPETLAAKNNLACFQAKLEMKPLQSLPLQRKAIEFRQNILFRFKNKLGENHPNTATAMNNLAVILVFLKRYEEALELQQKVLQSRRLCFGEDNPNTVNATKKLEKTLALMNKRGVELTRDESFEEALELQQKVLQSRRLYFGEDNPNTVSAIKELEKTLSLINQHVDKLSRDEKNEEALKLLQKALEKQIIIFGDEHPNTLIMKKNELILKKKKNLILLKNQRNALIKFKRYNKALELHEEILKAEPDNTFPACPPIDAINIFDYFSECQQSDIIEASPQKSFFVDAGPGAGKTYTLIRKLEYLVSHEHVNADGILVLCFTNAAINEIKDRLKKYVDEEKAHRSLVNVDIRTFHSFAMSLIRDANYHFSDDPTWDFVDLDLIFQSYKPRHKAFAQFIKIARDRIVAPHGSRMVEEGDWEYFVVDEVQDLTNATGCFVLDIINACLIANCGVTVMGDACQAIYDFQNRNNVDPRYDLDSQSFYKKLFQMLFGKAYFTRLTGNHRQVPELINLAMGIREAIIYSDLSKMYQAALEYKCKVPTIDMTCAHVNKLFLDIIRGGGKIGVLLSKNKDTKNVSDDFLKHGISNILKIGNLNNEDSNENTDQGTERILDSGNYFAPWIADIFAKRRDIIISKDVFLDKYKKSTGKDGITVWHHLKKLVNTDGNNLNVREMIDAIAKADMKDPYLRIARCNNVIVSNIHQSKGREYKCVVIDKAFFNDLKISEDSRDKYRMLYVAATRAEEHVYLADLLDRKQVLSFSYNPEKMIIERWSKSECGKPAYLEFNTINDVSCNEFINVPFKTFTDLSVGDAVYLKKYWCKGIINYKLIHEKTDKVILEFVNKDNSFYIRALIAYMKHLGLNTDSYTEMPSVIRNLYISGIFSQVVDKQYLDFHRNIREKARNGVWKWIEIVGVGYAEYDYEDA